MRFLIAPKYSATVVMTPQECAAYTLGGGEVFGAAPNGQEGVYYWLREGRWIKVLVEEAGEVE